MLPAFDVFVSYKHDADATRANAVRENLEALDIRVFMDLKISQDPNSGNFIKALHNQLATVPAVMVIWTEASLQSDYVIGEAEYARAGGKLVPVRFGIPATRLLVPFTMLQTPDLSNWAENGARPDDPEWQSALEMLGRQLRRPGLARLARIVALKNEADDAKEEAAKAKRLFVRDYPDDPFADRFISELKELERSEFELELKARRDSFEQKLAQFADILRAGATPRPPVTTNEAKVKTGVPAAVIPSPKSGAKSGYASEHRWRLGFIVLACVFLAALLYGRQVIADFSVERNALRGSVTDAQKQLKEVQTRLASTQTDLADVQKRLEQANAVIADFKAKDLAGALEDARTKLGAANAQVQTLKSDIADRETAIAKLNERVKQLDADNGQLQGRQRIAQQALDSFRAQTAKAQEQVEDLTARLDKANQEIKNAQAELAPLTEAQRQRVTAISNCNELTAYEYDSDRPDDVSFNNEVESVNEAAAINSCWLSLSSQSTPEARRRVLIQLARGYFVQAKKAIKAGNSAAASQASETMLRLSQLAMLAGSAQAADVLGLAFGGYLFDAQPASLPIDQTQAWIDFQKAANSGNRPALVWAGLYAAWPGCSKGKVPDLLRSDPARAEAYWERAKKYRGKDYWPAYYAEAYLTYFTEGEAKGRALMQTVAGSGQHEGAKWFLQKSLELSASQRTTICPFDHAFH